MDGWIDLLLLPLLRWLLNPGVMPRLSASADPSEETSHSELSSLPPVSYVIAKMQMKLSIILCSSVNTPNKLRHMLRHIRQYIAVKQFEQREEQLDIAYM